MQCQTSYTAGGSIYLYNYFGKKMAVLKKILKCEFIMTKQF